MKYEISQIKFDKKQKIKMTTEFLLKKIKLSN